MKKEIKFVILVLFAMIITSCSENSSNSSNYIDKREIYYKKKQHNYHVNEVTYKRVICPKCNGVGEVEFSTAGKVMLGIVTFGFGCLTNPTDVCETCHGTGYIEIPDI